MNRRISGTNRYVGYDALLIKGKNLNYFGLALPNNLHEANLNEKVELQEIKTHQKANWDMVE